MKDLLSKIFDRVILYEADCIELGRKLDKEVLGIMEPLKESRTDGELDGLKDMICSAAYHAQKHGFYLGIQAAAEILAEAAGPQDDAGH